MATKHQVVGVGQSRGRRWGVAAVATAAMLLVAPALTSAAPLIGPAAPQAFVSRPDLQPPVVNVLTPAQNTEPGYLFLAPKGDGAQAGPLIMDDAGQPVWFSPEPAITTDFKVQRYRGEPVLTWWQGAIGAGFGGGSYVVMDRAYRQIATIEAGSGLAADLHDMILTPQGTALLVAYNTVPGALLPILPGPDRTVLEGVVQEVDLTTGEVLFEWRSLADVAPEESTVPPPADPAAPWDYFHINSVEQDFDGNLLVSARHTDAIYKVDRSTGGVQWRLGGKRSDFAMGPGATFAAQHDARRQPDGTLSLFDNASKAPADVRSRPLVLDVDEQARTAGVVRSATSPEGLLSFSQGNHQVLPGGNSLVGWGSQPFVTEFGADGEVLFHATFGAGMDSYRAFRFDWTAEPPDAPAAAAQRGPDAAVTAFASWNGATEVASWTVLAGPDPEQLAPAATAPRAGFETAIPVGTGEPFVAVQALDGDGAVLGTSPAVPVTG